MSGDGANGRPPGHAAASAVDQVFACFHARGARTYGERITMLQHALQAAVFAERDGAEDELIAASLLHDFGHLVDGMGEDAAGAGIDAEHEAVGAAWLARYFGDAVVEPGRLHVEAKRYLCAVEGGYFDGLSEASRQSLTLQGGPMTPAEVERFRRRPWAYEAVRLRRYDDDGKVCGMKTPPLEHYRPLLERLVLVDGDGAGDEHEGADDDGA